MIDIYIFTDTYIYICVCIHRVPDAAAQHTLTSTLGWTPKPYLLHTYMCVHIYIYGYGERYRSKYGTDIDINICMHV